jgi:hypothetical protein
MGWLDPPIHPARGESSTRNARQMDGRVEPDNDEGGEGCGKLVWKAWP